MSLAAGTRLGPYEIAGIAGVGGMGEVYRARDTRLDRTVAIKILPADVAADPDRRDRFEREARAVAALNHPNICTLYDVGRERDLDFIVMEFVEGETLAERISRGPLSMAEARPIALQMTDALDAAHEKGIVHRDLKPANVRITPEAVVKVLDFGLAKALDPLASGPGVADAANSPTFAAGSTRLGVILGTASYMSPEQARGLRADRRTDIWAFGCVLYEMLTGRQVFAGETVTDALAAIVSREPDWNLLPADLPPPVRRTLARCLQKDQKLRLRDIADARLDLEDVPPPVPAASDSVTAPAPTSRWSRRVAALVMASAVVALAIGGVAGRWWAERQIPATVEWQGDLLGGSTVAMGPRISPDGQMLAFLAMVDGQSQVAVMKPQSGNWTILSRDRTRGLVQDVSWSHDGNRIFFDRFSEVPRGIFSIPALGGDERLVLEDAALPQSLPDGSLLVVRINAQRVHQLFHFWPDSGRLDALNALFPSTLGGLTPVARAFPDGQDAVFVGSTPESPTVQGVFVINLASGRTRRLAPDLSPGAQTPIGVTPDGRSVLLALPSGNVHRIVQVPRDGTAPIQPLITLMASPSTLDVGPDGSLYVDQSERIKEILWHSAATGRTERRALPETTRGSTAALPLPDGRVLFGSVPAGREQLAVMAPGRDAVPFLETDEPTQAPIALLGTDRVAFRIGTPTNERIAIASLADGRIVRRLPRPAGSVTALAGSPDGKTLFYIETGVIWAMSSEGGEPRKVHDGHQVAVDPTGRSLIVEVTARETVKLVRVPIAGGTEQPIPWSSKLRLISSLSPSAVAPDGRIAVRVVSDDSWFWPAAILDPRSGALTQLPGVRDLDMPAPAWGSDGRLVSPAVGWKSAIWRFRPVTRTP